MALQRTPSRDTSYLEEIAAAVRETFDSMIEVVIEGEPGKFDRATDTVLPSGPDTPLLSPRPARIQHLAISEQNGSGDWSTKRRYRVQADFLEGDPYVGDHAIVRVISCDHDPRLNGATLFVQNSAVHAVLTIETVTERGGGPNG